MITIIPAVFIYDDNVSEDNPLIKVYSTNLDGYYNVNYIWFAYPGLSLNLTAIPISTENEIGIIEWIVGDSSIGAPFRSDKNKINDLNPLVEISPSFGTDVTITSIDCGTRPLSQGYIFVAPSQSKYYKQMDYIDIEVGTIVVK